MKLPLGWKIVTVKDVCSAVLGGGTPSTKNRSFWDGDINWITSADINGIRDISPRKKITRLALSNSTTNLVPKGTIIVVTRVGLGKIAIAPYDLAFNQDCQGLILDGSKITQGYALHVLSRAVQEFKQTGRGTTINGVTKKQLTELEFALPPIEEQPLVEAKIDQMYSEIDHGTASINKVLKQFEVMKHSVLKSALEGKFAEGKAK